MASAAAWRAYVAQDIYPTVEHGRMTEDDDHFYFWRDDRFRVRVFKMLSFLGDVCPRFGDQMMDSCGRWAINEYFDVGGQDERMAAILRRRLGDRFPVAT